MSTDVASLLSHAASLESCGGRGEAASASSSATAAVNAGAAANDNDDDDEAQIVFVTCLTCGNVASQHPNRRKKTICPFCGNFYDVEAANAARGGGGGGGGGGESLPSIGARSLDARPKTRNTTNEGNSRGDEA